MAHPSTVDSSEKIRHVGKQACFSQLTPSEIDTLATLLIETHFSAGDVIVTEGDPVDSVFFIVSGRADVRHITINNGVTHVQSLAVLEEDATIGLNDTGFYSLTGRRTATVVALTDMITLRLDVAKFHGFSLANSHVNEVMRMNAARVMQDDK